MRGWITYLVAKSRQIFPSSNSSGAEWPNPPIPSFGHLGGHQHHLAGGQRLEASGPEGATGAWLEKVPELATNDIT